MKWGNKIPNVNIYMGNKNSYRGMKDNIDTESRFSVNFYFRSDDNIKIEYYTNADIEIFNMFCLIRKNGKRILNIKYSDIQNIGSEDKGKYIILKCVKDKKIVKYNLIFKKKKRGILFYRNLVIHLYKLAKELNFITEEEYEKNITFYKKLVIN